MTNELFYDIIKVQSRGKPQENNLKYIGDLKMKKTNELKYKIIACYNPREDETYHFLIFKDNDNKFLAPNIIIDYGVKFHKVCPDYEIPAYTDLDYDSKNNKTYVMLVGKGNPYGLTENNKNVKIN